MRSCDVSFVVSFNKLNNQSRCWWFESAWRLCDVMNCDPLRLIFINLFISFMCVSVRNTCSYSWRCSTFVNLILRQWHDISLRWRYNGRDGVSNHEPHDCLLNRLFGHRSKKHQSSASLAFVRGIHRWPHKWPVTRKMFPFDDVIMSSHLFITVSHGILYGVQICHTALVWMNILF